MGGVSRYPIDMRCLTNQFVVGDNKLVNVATERKEDIRKEKRKLEIIFDSVKYFKKKMEANIEEIKNVVEETEGNRPREQEGWSIAIENLRQAFDETDYIDEK